MRTILPFRNIRLKIKEWNRQKTYQILPENKKKETVREMSEKVVLILVVLYRTVTKLGKRLEEPEIWGRIEATLITSLLRLGRILRRALEN